MELAVANPDREAHDQFTTEFPDARLHSDVEEMFEDPVTDGDIFVATTPPFIRRDLEIVGFESNRHGLCEKRFVVGVPSKCVYSSVSQITVVSRTHHDVGLGSFSK